MYYHSFCYRLKTRDGGLVNQIRIGADSETVALERLRRMYPRSVILESWIETSKSQRPLPQRHHMMGLASS